MPGLSTIAPSAQHDFSSLCQANELAAKAHAPPKPLSIVTASAAGLVIASAVFGAVYAWTAGSHHSVTIFDIPVLAVLAVCMAVSLEIAKPYAIATALASFRQWRIVQGVLLAILGLIAVTYSLTSEISLMAMLRSDNAAQRQTAIATNSNEAAATKRQTARYDSAKRELDALAPSRPAAEIQALTDGLLQTPGVDGCTEINGPTTRRICPKVSSARQELARAQRRTELEAIMSVAVTPGAKPNTPVEAMKVADPGAYALATYLAVLGITVKDDAVSEWMVLIGVLALELGSALAGILAGVGQGTSASLRKPALSTTREKPVIDAVAEPSNVIAQTVVLTSAMTTPENLATINVDGASNGEALDGVTSLVTIPQMPVRAAGRDEAAKRLLDLLRNQGGRFDGSRRSLAKLIEATPSTVYGAIAELIERGSVIAEASSTGTRIRLAA